VDGCNVTNIPLNLLRLHAHNHSISVSINPDLAASYDFLKGLQWHYGAPKCDLKKCKRWFREAESNCLQEHLLNHPLEDRLAQKDVVSRMGYDPVSARIICPVCQQHLANSAEFVTHLETAHLTTDYDHWLSFKGCMTGKCAPYHLPWGMWYFRGRKPEERYCQYCGQNASSQKDVLIDHHLGLLKISDEIRAARASILRLLPSFVNHPVFEMDRPSVLRP